MNFDFGYAWDILPGLAKASLVTLQASIAGFAVAAVLGLILALLGNSSSRLVRLLVRAFIEFVRSTPLLIQLFFLFYVLPEFGLLLEPLPCGIVALGIHYATYTSEVYRSGIAAVPTAQWEAAVALNLRPRDTWTRIILPQAIRPVIPALGNYQIAMFKESAILSVITVHELLGQALNEASLTFRYLEPIAIVGVIFLAFSVPSSYLIRRLERRYA